MSTDRLTRAESERFDALEVLRPIPAAVETLFASEEAAAIERILDDVADVAGNDAADTDRGLKEALFEAFVTGDERAWRSVYEILDVLVTGAGASATPALTRLASFLAENDDLAQPARDHVQESVKKQIVD
jgi:hypothetical protein